MSILTGPEIERVIRRTRARRDHGYTPGMPDTLPWIDVEPYLPACVGPNSVDVHLGETLIQYDTRGWSSFSGIDPNSPPPTLVTPATETVWENGKGWVRFDAPVWILHPGTLYLGSTAERVECHGVVPWIDGRSSVGRLGVSVHVTAGRGDDGWAGHFTLEITVVHPTILRPGMRLSQVTFVRTEGERRPYRGRYAGAVGPEASRFHQGGSGS